MNLPETITLLPDKPSWEVILFTTQDKRSPGRLTIHAAIFDSLWSEAGKMGQSQGDPRNRMMYDVEADSSKHGEIVNTITDWLWEILESGNLKQMRFSSGKWLNEDLMPHYDNCIDVDVSLVLEGGKYEHLCLLIDRMLSYNRKYTEFKEITDGSRQINGRSDLLLQRELDKSRQLT